MASSEMPINYLAPTEKSPSFPPLLITLFRKHFHSCVPKGGTQEEFLEGYKNFRVVYDNHMVQEVLGQKNPNDLRLNPQVQKIKEHNKQLLDEFLMLVIGMGQISNGFKLIPGAPTAEPVQSRPPAKGKRPESRRYVHVLGNMIRKSVNPQRPGPHGIPEEARDKVPEPSEMIETMIAAMKNEVGVLDYFDTKPYKDHWKAMSEDDFTGLATTLFTHMNDLHQGIDYVEGFRYKDRYQNLVSLLHKCKGTIYFMSRPSTYEDVLLNPHMMELRFADNQKNNAKKKIDNRELTARRNQEYFAIHGCSPPPKERVLKGAARGKKLKRAAPEDNENDGDISTPAKAAPKRRKANPKGKGKAKGKGKDVAPAAATTPPGSVEGNSVQDGAIFTPSNSSIPFLDVSPLQEEEGLPEQNQYWDPQQQYHQSALQQFQQPLLKPKPKGPDPVVDQTSGIAVSIAPGSEYDQIDNEIITKIYSCVYEEPTAEGFVCGDLEPSPFQQFSAIRGPTDNTKSQNDQIDHYQGDESLLSQQIFPQKEPVYQSQEWYNNDKQYLQRVNTELQPVDQGSRTRQTRRQKAHQQQIQHQQQALQQHFSQISEKDFMADQVSGWGTDGQAIEVDDAVHTGEPPKLGGTTLEIEPLDNDGFIEKIMRGGSSNGGQDATYTPTELFSGQPSFEQEKNQAGPLFTGSDMNQPGYNDIAGNMVEGEDFSGVGWDGAFLFDGPVDENGDQFFDPYTLPGGDRMEDMEMLLKENP